MAEGRYQWCHTGPGDDDGHYDWVPFQYRHKYRSYSAGVSGDANSGAIEPAAATPAGTRDAETPQEASDASDASAAEPSAKVLLGIAELQRLRMASGGNRKVHDEARNVLNNKIRSFAEAPAGHVRSLPIVAEEWPTWKEYIANHKEADKVLGSKGIVVIRIEEIEGTSDSNREGKPCVDIVVYTADGYSFRLQPGNKRARVQRGRLLRRADASEAQAQIVWETREASRPSTDPLYGVGQSVLHWRSSWFESGEPRPKGKGKKKRPRWFSAEIVHPPVWAENTVYAGFTYTGWVYPAY